METNAAYEKPKHIQKTKEMLMFEKMEAMAVSSRSKADHDDIDLSAFNDICVNQYQSTGRLG